MHREKLRLQHFEPERGRRILVTSDIHANLPYLKGLLKKAAFCSNDYLIIDGDFLEKGPDSLGTLRYIMKLSEGGNVFPLIGNCDSWYLMFKTGPAGDVHLNRYFRSRKGGFLYEMLSSLGIRPEECTDASRYYGTLKEIYGKELSFLESLPHIIETDRFIFAHAGIDGGIPLSQNTSDRVTARDAFLNEGQSFEKWVIVGHWPVMLYSPDIVTANPVILPERKIISIDGACVLKDDGQLNALVIPDGGSENFSRIYYDSFPERTVLTGQEAGGSSYYIRWGDSTVRVLNRGEEFSRCRHVRTGYEMDILTKYLFSDSDITDCNDCSDYVLPLKPGDRVGVIEETSRGFYVKHEGVSGWYFGELE